MNKRTERIKGINEAANWLGKRIDNTEFAGIQDAFDMVQCCGDHHITLDKWDSEEVTNYMKIVKVKAEENGFLAEVLEIFHRNGIEE